MRKLALVLGIMAVVCFVASAYAQAPVAPATKPVVTEIKGTVAKVDTVKKEITVKPLIGAEKVIAVAVGTKITKAGKAITLADIKVDDKVTVEEEAGEVKSIVVAVPVVVPVVPVPAPTK